MMEPIPAHVHAICVSNGGVPKLPVPQACITLNGLQGDHQRTRGVHGGVSRAVCLYSTERIDALRNEGHHVVPGSFGENLTLTGLDWAQLAPGDRLRVGDNVRLELTSYTAPCKANAQWFVDGDFMRISQKRHPGWSRLYAKVLNEGVVRVNDAVYIETVSAPVS